MAGRRNYNTPGHAHELTFSCYRRLPLLKADRTCRWLAEAIDKAREKHDFALWAYVFMPDHVHLVVHPRQAEYDIATIRRAIKSPVAKKALEWIDENASEWAEQLTRRRGDRIERLFWQSGGGYDRNVDQAKTLQHVVDYVHANPVRLGLVEHPWDWNWSSAASFFEKGCSPLTIDRVSSDWCE